MIEIAGKNSSKTNGTQKFNDYVIKGLKFHFLVFLSALAADRCVLAADNGPAPGQGKDATPQSLDVEGVKKKYWAVGDESKVSVVQDRYYSKNHRVELGVMGASYYGSPFYNTRSLGGLVGYHFSESLSVKAMFLKDFVSDSSALETFRATSGYGVNANATQSFGGAELAFSPIYGKLSLMGSQILYFDIHGSLGAGMTNTDNGNYATVTWGLGQQIFLAKDFAFGLDFKWFTFNEDIVERYKLATLGKKIDEQRVFNTSIIVGLYLFL